MLLMIIKDWLRVTGALTLGKNPFTLRSGLPTYIVLQLYTTKIYLDLQAKTYLENLENELHKLHNHWVPKKTQISSCNTRPLQTKYETTSCFCPYVTISISHVSWLTETQTGEQTGGRADRKINWRTYIQTCTHTCRQAYRQTNK